MPTLIFTISRMNPPTPGHMEVVKELFHQAIRLGESTVYIILSKKRDDKNPIPCSKDTNRDDATKLEVLEHLIQGLRDRLISMESNKQHTIQSLHVVPVCVNIDEISPFVTLRRILEEQPLIRDLFVIIGEDRADMVESIRNVVNKKAITPYHVDSYILKRPGMDVLKATRGDAYTHLDVDAIEPSEISGSFVRNLVRDGQENLFKRLYHKYAPHMPQNLIQKLYRTIEEGTKKKRVREPPPTTSTQKRSTRQKRGGRTRSRQWRRNRK